MDIDKIQNSFRATVSDSIILLPEGVDRYQIFTPFHFDDGDHFVIVLRKDKSNNFIITDEGHTYMHMSYHMELSSLKSGIRNLIVESALEKHKVTEENGQIFVKIDDMENAGNIFYSFIQCLTSITNISYLSRERVVSTFMEDFRSFITENVDLNRVEFDYHNQEHDQVKNYLVDCRINGMSRPLHIYGIGNDNKCRDTTIGLLKFQSWKVPLLSMGIFEEQEQVSRKVLARFTDVCDRQFSSLASNQERIRNYFRELMN